MAIKITKQLATMEDLAIGTGPVVQKRNGVPLTLTKIDLITASILASEDAGKGAALVSMEGGPSVQSAVTTNAADILDRVIRVTSIAAMEALAGVIDGAIFNVLGSVFVWDDSNSRFNLVSPYVTLEAYSDVALAGDWGAAINRALEDGYGNIVATGEYYEISTRVTSFYSGVTVDMAGATVKWIGTGNGSLSDHVFLASGATTGTSAAVASETLEYGTEIPLTSNPFSVGDYARVVPDDSTDTSIYARYVFQIVKIDGNSIFTNYPLRLSLFSDGVEINKIEPIKNVKIKNVNFTATNQTERAIGIGCLSFVYGFDCSAENIESTQFWFKTCLSTYCVRTSFKDIRTIIPAATGGGEGYGVQFNYSYLSSVVRSSSVKARHSVDFTASGYCIARDCTSSGSEGAGFLSHKANEYNITLENCHSSGDIAGFALGGLDTGFADITDNVTVINCSAIEFRDYGLIYIQKGRGLSVDGFISSPKDLTGGFTENTVAVANADVSLRNINIKGKIRVYNPVGATSDGYANLYSSSLETLPNNRALSVIGNGRLKVFGSTINGELEILTNGTVELVSVSHTSTRPFTQDSTGTVKYMGGELEFGTASENYTKPSNLSFDGTVITRVNSGATIISTGGTLSVTGKCGDLRLVIVGGNLSLNGAEMDGKITLSNFTGRSHIVGSVVDGGYDDLAGGGYSANIVSSNFGAGLKAGNATSGFVINNEVIGTKTLPSASATMIVKDNI